MMGPDSLNSCDTSKRGVALFAYDEMVPANVVDVGVVCWVRATDPRHDKWQHNPQVLNKVLAEFSRITSGVHVHIGGICHSNGHESPDAMRTPHIGTADQIIIYKSPWTRN